MFHALINIRFFQPADAVLVPFYVAIFYYLLSAQLRKNAYERYAGIIKRAFTFKIFVISLFVFLTEFYFKGGDTALYYQGIKDMRAAISYDNSNLNHILLESRLTEDSPIFPFFFYDGYEFDLTWNYMLGEANYAVPRIALLFSYLCGNSFFVLCLFFGLFAFWASVKLFQVFIHFYPDYKREIAFAILFLPSVLFWSSGLLKDSLTLGCLGLFCFYVTNVLIKRVELLPSILGIVVTGYIMFLIKGYILLTLLLAISIWIFSDLSLRIRNKIFRTIINYFLILCATIIGFQGVNSLTAFENAKEYKVEKLLQTAEVQRGHYAVINEQLGKKDSYFTINTNSIGATILSGFVATFYRPFLWEINTPIAFLAFLESTVYLLLTFYFIRKRGLIKLFSIPFSDSRILFCFVFSITFAVAVGISSTNFGALSRYKIPCLSFYLIYLLLIMRKTNLSYPKWFSRILSFSIPNSISAAQT